MSEDIQEVVHRPTASAFTWRLDEESFDGALVELLRGGDTVSPRVAVDEIARDLIELLPTCGQEQVEEVKTVLNRLTSIGAAFLRFDRPKLFDAFVRTTLNIYLSGFGERGNRFLAAGSGISSPELWLHIATRVLAIGAYAVRVEEWGAVRKLALQTFPESPYSSSGETQYWLHHAELQAGNANLLNVTGEDVKRGGTIIALARRLADATPSLRPDLPQNDERLLNSIAQFDLLALLITCADAGDDDQSYVYPSMAAWGLRRAEPVLVKLLSDERIRGALFAASLDEKLFAKILREVQAYGYSLSSGSWGWRSKLVRDSLSRHPEQR